MQSARTDVPQMSVSEYAGLRGNTDPPLLLDIREAWEREICLIPESHWIPQHEVKARLNELPRDRDLVIQCRSGVRSHRIAAELLGLGYTRVWNLAGGILDWGRQIDPEITQY